MNLIAVRRVRLVAGLVLLVYVTLHLLNHALGLVSLAAMEVGRVWFLALWRNPLGTAALYGAIIVHGVLALWILYQRRTLRMPAWEAAQTVLGLALPWLLAGHVTGTRIAWTRFGAEDTYARMVLLFWVQAPAVGAWQATALAVAWVHACIGIHFWLRFRPWYSRAGLALFTAALLLPVLALLGFTTAGREVAALARQPGWAETVAEATRAPGPAERALLGDLAATVTRGYLLALGAVLLARGARRLHQRRGAVHIAYPGDRVVTVPAGFTILEASRLAGIPHASVCGGRGRCSTCRVRVIGGAAALPPPHEAERRVLTRVGAAPDVRLACQARPRGAVAVVPLVRVSLPPAESLAHADARQGREQEVVVLFADLRGFTRLAEQKLPYDVVFFLNRYFEVVGAAIERAGGIANQFTGDGVMALFGVETSSEAGSRAAIEAARLMVARVGALSRELSAELREPLRIGIGLHVGPAVVGRMGYGEGRYLTAVGDTVHVAARLEQLTKDYDCELVLSEEAAARAGLDVGAFPRHEVAVRNRAAPVTVRVIDRAARLPLTG
jgi:adenylate cyclase